MIVTSFFQSTLLALAASSAAATAFAGKDADDVWPRFRGHNGSGFAPSAIPSEWTDASFRWQTELPGSGHGSPVVWKNKVFLNAARDKGKERLVVALDAGTGEILWVRAFPSATHKTHKFNSYASSTPAVDANGVYFAWGHKSSLQFAALSHEGEPLWETDLGGVAGGHGFGVSPIVHGDLVVLPNDMEKGGGFLVAVEAKTGKIRWKLPRASKRLTYSTPCVFTAPDGSEELIFSNWWLGVTSVNPAGKQLWELSVFGRPHAERAIASPFTNGKLVYATCGFTTLDKHLVAIRPASASKSGKPEEVWRTESTVPHIPTPLLAGNRLYTWADNGVVTCLRPDTGEQVWKARVENVRDTFYGSPVLAGDVLFCASSHGQIVALADADEFRQFAVNDLKEVCRSTPALANGDLYLRLYERIVCVKGVSAE